VPPLLFTVWREKDALLFGDSRRHLNIDSGSQRPGMGQVKQLDLVEPIAVGIGADGHCRPSCQPRRLSQGGEKTVCVVRHHHQPDRVAAGHRVGVVDVENGVVGAQRTGALFGKNERVLLLTGGGQSLVAGGKL